MAEARLTSRAKQEYADALRWYLGRSVTAAAGFDEAMDAAVTAISEHPERYELRTDQLRCCRLQGYPYQLIYRVQAQVVQVVAVAHLRREPDYWLKPP